MKQYNTELNTVALDVTLEALFGTKGRDDAKRVYELFNARMITVWNDAATAESEAKLKYLNDQLDQRNAMEAETLKAAEAVGYKKGRAAVLFEQAVDELNNEAAGISPALAPPSTEPCEETALVNAASALG